MQATPSQSSSHVCYFTPKLNFLATDVKRKMITTGRVASIINVTRWHRKIWRKEKEKATFQKRKNRIRQSDKVNCTDYILETIKNKANWLLDG